jgi:hypothetical protein
MNFITDLKEEINSSIEKYFTSVFLIVGDFNFRIGKRQLQKPHKLVVRKHWNSESCNSAENTCNEGKRCNVEANKYKDIFETNNLEILNGKFRCDARGEFTFIIIRE